MKTLVQPLVSINTETYLNQSCRQNRLKIHSTQYRKLHAKLKFLLLVMSFFTFITFPESPEIDGNICNKYNNEKSCNVW